MAFFYKILERRVEPGVVLEGPEALADHVVRIHAAKYTPVDGALAVTGEILPVAGTPFDFRVAKTVAAALDELQTYKQGKESRGRSPRNTRTSRGRDVTLCPPQVTTTDGLWVSTTTSWSRSTTNVPSTSRTVWPGWTTRRPVASSRSIRTNRASNCTQVASRQRNPRP